MSVFAPSSQAVSFFLIIFLFMCMTVLLEYLSVCHVCAWCPRSSEEYVWSPVIGVRDHLWAVMWVPGIELRSSIRTTSSLKHGELPSSTLGGDSNLWSKISCSPCAKILAQSWTRPCIDVSQFWCIYFFFFKFLSLYCGKNTLYESTLLSSECWIQHC